jgi:hypothetical protein
MKASCRFEWRWLQHRCVMERYEMPPGSQLDSRPLWREAMLRGYRTDGASVFPRA